MNIPNKVIQSLMESGWYSSRNIDISSYEEAYKSEGYKISETIIEFLKKFGGVDIIIPAFRRHESTDKVYIDPIRAINGVYRGNVLEYEKKIGKSVVVIGETQNEQLVLIMDENGEVYAAFDDYLAKLGNNIYEALDTFCESKQPIEV
ncbi:SUKH-3 domain-containing protein [Clostridium botulinum]|uniref:SUKH-3 domain-containing protein n=1 Tax=Clostridium botulinum TaxID=1491 RepID=A0A9Q1ZFJ0_CLOBO|nr:SUKH-3 domain-containing protein [Clostridium botulinum]AEB75057.1 hypothetical protein CbC4_0377 [Clostridium botulinum BKT015925]KEI02245.1 hypothetical protein Y848_08085 [Clostridium botulinum C/D str. Sp77]KEI03567.1 hypothetical protein Z953_03675 [Clostridium botulinum D str. 16868]KLU74984.1 hypothetical protein CBC3_11010 [Clostridium botulinum V891]KOA77772.1 hypothetical protein ADU77_06740 [Clostridium botulinum]